MNLVVYGFPQRVGALTASNSIIDLNLAYTSYRSFKGHTRPYAAADVGMPSKLIDFIQTEDAVSTATEVVEWVESDAEHKRGPMGESVVLSRKSVIPHAALPSMSSRIICSAANYPDHIFAAYERLVRQGRPPPFGQKWSTVQDVASWIAAKPYWGFQKWPQNLTEDGETVHVRKWVKYFDYECEIFACIGKKVRNVSKKDARKAIFGYGILNDWSVRDGPSNVKGARIFDESNSLNLNLKKNIGGVTIGSTMVVDEEFDPYNLKMTTRLNGELRQNGRTGDMVRNFEDIISYLSEFYDLYPGDIIAAGTCAGTAAEAGDTAKSVHDGDVVECTVEKVGSFSNKVRFDR